MMEVGGKETAKNNRGPHYVLEKLTGDSSTAEIKEPPSKKSQSKIFDVEF